MHSRVIFTVCAVILLIGTVSNAAVPTSITVQGRLTNTAGDPLPGSTQFVFKIFSDTVGGTELWPGGAGEIQTITVATDGLWVGLVGAVNPLNDAVFTDASLWLQISADGTILPRVRLVSGPFAFRVASVDGASGGNITSKVRIGPGNSNSGDQAFVAGEGNSATGDHSVIGGGQSNTASFPNSTVSGGVGNAASFFQSTVGGGMSNTASGAQSTVGGGESNTASDFYSTVGGGMSNTASANQSTVGGGGSNMASGNYSTVGGGRDDTASGSSSTVSGGESNSASGSRSTVSGGESNSSSGTQSTVSGGVTNTASGSRSTVGGGESNDASFSGSTIGGGVSNDASGRQSVVAGGGQNNARGEFSTVGGGGGLNLVDSNAANGDYAVVPGGNRNRAAGDYSFAAGHNSQALHTSAFVWADSGVIFPSTNARQFLIRATGGVGIGTNAPEAPLHIVEGSAGSVIASGDASAVFERDTHNYVTILSPDNTERGVLFGSPANSAAGGVLFNTSCVPNGFEFRANTNDTRMTLSSTGTLTVLGVVIASTVPCPSDERLKQNIRGLDDPLGKIEQLRGVGYEWRSEARLSRNLPDGEQIGVLAQDVQKVVPSAVVKMDDGYLAVDYARLVPLLIEGMKEQQEQINELKSRLDRQTP